MGFALFKKKQIKQEEHNERKLKFNKDYNNVFQELADIKDLMIKGAMLLSESVGKPKRTYEDIKMLASSKHFPKLVNNGVLRLVRNKITGKLRAMRIIKRDIIECREDESLFLKELAILRTLV
jgi:hypothetical protein